MSFFSFLGRLADRIADRFVEETTPDPEPTPEPTQNIAEIALGNPDFEALVGALSATNSLNGLLDTALNDAADITVFAPTDDAFRDLAITLGIDVAGVADADLPGAIVAGLTVALGSEAAALDLVSEILKYHVKLGGSTKEEIETLGTIDTLVEDATLESMFTVSNDHLVDADPDVENPAFVEGLTDLAATNGFVQVIDKVLLPLDVMEAEGTSQPTIAGLAAANGSFNILVAALTALNEQNGLLDAANDPNADLTVFAPTDDAFISLAGRLNLDISGLNPEDDALEIATLLVGALGAETVTAVLQYHIVAERKSVEDLQDDQTSSTLLKGEFVGIDGTTIVDGAPGVGDASLVAGLTDLEASNGLIQVVDEVLLPIDVAGVGPQTLTGNSGTNFLVGGDSNDTLSGRGGDDVLLAGGGDDRAAGGRGDDTIIAGEGNDIVIGGSGNDLIIEGLGDDTYWGGFGVDTFDLTHLDGNNRINDFGPPDQLIFSSEDFADEQAVLDAAENVFLGVRIETEDGSITIRGLFDLEADQISIA